MKESFNFNKRSSCYCQKKYKIKIEKKNYISRDIFEDTSKIMKEKNHLKKSINIMVKQKILNKIIKIMKI